MEDWQERSRRLIGDAAVNRLASARVAVFGVGGVGGYAVEALARCGVGYLTLVDGDRVSLTNLNRQLIATRETLGRLKVEVAAERVRSICPGTTVDARALFFDAENAEQFDFGQYDYVIDAVDDVQAKVELVLSAHRAGVPIISSMGAGNKLDPSGFRVADLAQTAVDPLARVMRTRLKKLGVRGLKVVFSTEKPMKPSVVDAGGRTAPGSIAFVPAAAGLVLAGEVVRDLTGVRGEGSGI